MTPFNEIYFSAHSLPIVGRKHCAREHSNIVKWGAHENFSGMCSANKRIIWILRLFDRGFSHVNFVTMYSHWRHLYICKYFPNQTKTQQKAQREKEFSSHLRTSRSLGVYRDNCKSVDITKEIDEITACIYISIRERERKSIILIKQNYHQEKTSGRDDLSKDYF